MPMSTICWVFEVADVKTEVVQRVAVKGFGWSPDRVISTPPEPRYCLCRWMKRALASTLANGYIHVFRHNLESRRADREAFEPEQPFMDHVWSH